MATGALGRLNVELSADTAKFISDIGRAAVRFDAAMSRMAAGLGVLGGALAAVAGPAALVALAKNAINTGEQLHKVSQVTGRSVESLSELRLAWQTGSVELDGF